MPAGGEATLADHRSRSGTRCPRRRAARSSRSSSGAEPPDSAIAAVTVAVRALAGSAGVDASAGELQLVTPIAGIEKRDEPARHAAAGERRGPVHRGRAGAVGRTRPPGGSRRCSTPVAGARFAPGEAPQAGGGTDTGTRTGAGQQPDRARHGDRPGRRDPRTPARSRSSMRALLPRGRLAPTMIQISRVGVAVPGRPHPGGAEAARRRRPSGPSGQPHQRRGSVRRSGSAPPAPHRLDPPVRRRSRLRRAQPVAQRSTTQDYYRSCRSGVECTLLEPGDGRAGHPLRERRDPPRRPRARAPPRPPRLRADRLRARGGGDAARRAGRGRGVLGNPGRHRRRHARHAAQRAPPTSPRVARSLRRRAVRLRGARGARPADGAHGDAPRRTSCRASPSPGPGRRRDARRVRRRRRRRASAASSRLSDVTIGDSSARGIETVGNLVNSTLPVGGASIDDRDGGRHPAERPRCDRHAPGRRASTSCSLGRQR